MIRECARSTSESNLRAASGLRSLNQSNAASYSATAASRNSARSVGIGQLCWIAPADVRP